jgi:hypothetical protein
LQPQLHDTKQCIFATIIAISMLFPLWKQVKNKYTLTNDHTLTLYIGSNTLEDGHIRVVYFYTLSIKKCQPILTYQKPTNTRVSIKNKYSDSHVLLGKWRIFIRIPAHRFHERHRYLAGILISIRCTRNQRITVVPKAQATQFTLMWLETC